MMRDEVGLARANEVAMLQAIEIAAASLFSSDDLPAAQRDDAMALDTLTAALADGRLWVARDGGGRPVGFAVGDVVDGRPHLAEVSVQPDHGRRGLGTRLLDAVADWARERGSLLTLTTFAHVAWNAPYYARRGFRPLRDDEQGPELRAILRAEAGVGLRNRIAMGRPLERHEPTFRVAAAADLPAIVNLLADDVLGAARERDETPLPPSYRAAFDAIAADPNNELLVACLDDRVVGVLQITYTPHVLHQGGWRATIEGVRVASTLRSRGVGQAMFEAAFARARARGCGVVQLTTDKRRPAAKRFYERLGFAASHEGMKKRLD
jgi:GNAT superfamily N-acetyltransferase